MVIDVLEGVDFPSARSGSPTVIDDMGYEVGVDLHALRIVDESLFVVVSLVSGCVRNDQSRLYPQAAHQFDGIFDALSFDHTGGLEDKQFIGVEPQCLPNIIGIVIRRLWRVPEIHDIGNEGGG